MMDYLAGIPEGPTRLERMLALEQRFFLPDHNLAYTDRASMAASTEVRVPFVDPLVFRAAFSLPADARIHGRVQKAALKETARRWIPDEIDDRTAASSTSRSASSRTTSDTDIQPPVSRA